MVPPSPGLGPSMTAAVESADAKGADGFIQCFSQCQLPTWDPVLTHRQMISFYILKVQISGKRCSVRI